jgi:hypothetical protein
VAVAEALTLPDKAALVVVAVETAHQMVQQLHLPDKVTMVVTTFLTQAVAVALAQLVAMAQVVVEPVA